jgi:hypothetical protein
MLRAIFIGIVMTTGVDRRRRQQSLELAPVYSLRVAESVEDACQPS